MSQTQIGVIGYSAQSFDIDKAQSILLDAYDMIESEYNSVTIVSGLTNIGIPSLAYEEAENRDWKTVGIACSKARNYDCYPVDDEIIIGNEWGDESERFLSQIDVLIAIGGGDQTQKEIKKAKQYDIPTHKYNL